MRVTVLTDASFCHQTHAAGYGYWIACERGRKAGGGGLANPAQSSTSAEMAAICNAVYDGIRYMLILAEDELLIQTDCMGAIEVFERDVKSRKRPAPSVKPMWDIFQALKKDYSLQVRFRHVRAHTGLKETRFASNRLCDYRAKQEMRKMRQKLLQEAIL